MSISYEKQTLEVLKENKYNDIKPLKYFLKAIKGSRCLKELEQCQHSEVRYNLSHTSQPTINIKGQSTNTQPEQLLLTRRANLNERERSPREALNK
jgi:hypothetical protein